jgi:thioredoxin 1
VARYFSTFHLPTVYIYRDGQFHAELQCEARRDSIRHAAPSRLAAAPQDEP